MTGPSFSKGEGGERRQAVHETKRLELKDKTNRLSSGLVRILLWVAVVAHILVVVAAVVWLWVRFETPLPALIVAIVMSAIWVAWLRQVEFARAYEPVVPTVTRRFRAPSSGDE